MLRGIYPDEVEILCATFDVDKEELSELATSCPSSSNLGFLLGVSVRAINDYVRFKHSSDPENREWYKDAKVWLFEVDEVDQPNPVHSFAEVCMRLDQRCDLARERIRKMSIKNLPKCDRRSTK